MSDRAPQSWLRYLGLGLELGAAIAVPTLVGEWLDRRYGWAPWGVLGGFAFGLGAGFYHFIRSSQKALREAQDSDAATPHQDDAH